MSLTVAVLLTCHWDFLPTFLNLRPAFCPMWTHEAMKSLKTRPQETSYLKPNQEMFRNGWFNNQFTLQIRKRAPAIPLTKSCKSRRLSLCMPLTQWCRGLGHPESSPLGTRMLQRDKVHRWLKTWRGPWLNSDFSSSWAKIQELNCDPHPNGSEICTWLWERKLYLSNQHWVL